MSNVVGEDRGIYSTLGGDPDLGDLVVLFVEEMPERIRTLVEYSENGDWELLRRSAHQIRGAAGSHGFHQFTSIAERVETAVKKGRPEDEIRQALGELIELCRHARSGTPADC
jgi:HPt (histidine-containing phosphotransfer) domain-containing protein